MAVERDGVYAELMLEPEARVQFVKFLGLRKSVDPKPQLRIREQHYPLTAGWRQEEGSYTNVDNAYLPMPGIAELLSRMPRDAGPIVYYAVMHYKYLVIVQNIGQEPEQLLLQDKRIQASIATGRRTASAWAIDSATSTFPARNRE